MVPWRGSPERFGATVKATTPEPEPIVAEVMTNHGALLEAIHGRAVVPVLTVKDPEPPAAGTVKDGGLAARL
jgi:hypothetical protein